MRKDKLPTVGIDTIAFYTSRYFLDLATLAKVRKIDPQKFLVGLGQYKMAVPPPDEDIVTMGASAAKQALAGVDSEQIELLLLATESGIDQSKAGGIYIHDLLGLSSRCRVGELKQACYAGTLGLQLILPFLRENPDKKVLLIAADVARYGLSTPGEASQGCGAVAMVLGANPRLLAFEPEYGVITENIMDFWRPNYRDAALVDGKYSSRMYLQLLEKTWTQYQEQSQRRFSEHDFYCYHTPVSRLAEKAHCYLNKIAGEELLSEAALLEQLRFSLEYSRNIGNCYTASLYLSLVSLLDHVKQSAAGKRIGFYSYGSGCVAEFFSAVVQPDYHQVLNTAYHQELLKSRLSLSYEEYEDFYNFYFPTEGQKVDLPSYQTGSFRLAQLHEHKRIYEDTGSR
ncbi:MAG TPA: hydroxymethylglutaryl-CoA synthase [Gammaproteobacteria bacterium]|nr:hydroxymethylglutaryl-CoA synthase [Gammaproteobacteria bacterium]